MSGSTQQIRRHSGRVGRPRESDAEIRTAEVPLYTTQQMHRLRAQDTPPTKDPPTSCNTGADTKTAPRAKLVPTRKKFPFCTTLATAPAAQQINTRRLRAQDTPSAKRVHYILQHGSRHEDGPACEAGPNTEEISARYAPLADYQTSTARDAQSRRHHHFPHRRFIFAVKTFFFSSSGAPQALEILGWEGSAEEARSLPEPPDLVVVALK